MIKNLEYYKCLQYQIKTEPVEDSDGTKYWVAEISELRGCKTDGDSETEAITNLQELFDDYIETMLEANLDISEPEPLPQSKGETIWKFSNPPAPRVENIPKEETKETAGSFKKVNTSVFQPAP